MGSTIYFTSSLPIEAWQHDDWKVKVIFPEETLIAILLARGDISKAKVDWEMKLEREAMMICANYCAQIKEESTSTTLYSISKPGNLYAIYSNSSEDLDCDGFFMQMRFRMVNILYLMRGHGKSEVSEEKFYRFVEYLRVLSSFSIRPSAAMNANMQHAIGLLVSEPGYHTIIKNLEEYQRNNLFDMLDNMGLNTIELRNLFLDKPKMSKLSLRALEITLKPLNGFPKDCKEYKVVIKQQIEPNRALISIHTGKWAPNLDGILVNTDRDTILVKESDFNKWEGWFSKNEMDGLITIYES